VHFCVSAHSAVSPQRRQSLRRPGSCTPPPDSGPGGTGRVSQGEDRGRIEADHRLCATVVRARPQLPRRDAYPTVRGHGHPTRSPHAPSAR
jgi:hypothetical protein